MKLYTYQHEGAPRLGAECDGRIVDLNAAHSARLNEPGATLAGSMLEFIRSADRTMDAARTALAYVREQHGRLRELSQATDETKLLAPIPSPGKILCSGLNYKTHIEENPNATFLEDPRFFVKTNNAVIGPGSPILWPGERYQVDYEVELAVIIGRRARRVSAANAMTHVFGYTIFHDVTSRWIQFKDKNEDMGKNFDSFAPMGPCIVTADEIPDPAELRLITRVNGRTMQDGSNRDWCFSLPRVIEWLSSAMTLEPGDVVTTGTPAGVGLFRQPPVYLRAGDICELEIPGIGLLRNPVVNDEAPVPAH
jgi:2-keto-4-pentenoate hydratase/2-oxohepta-3-ene-1,7-dioic acid hydratase in catechol pathway